MELLKKIKEKSPLIHGITNPISINTCANATLALGARPIMAEHPKEVFEITKTSKCLLLNLGNITDIRMKSMEISADCANLHHVPIVLDLVGVSCSALRHTFADLLLKQKNIAVIKGNYSEIYAMYSDSYQSNGVDAEDFINISMAATAAKAMAVKYNTTVIASGKIDIVANNEKIIFVHNGTKTLSEITGTGCLLGMITACCLSMDRTIMSAVYACAILGICGELSVTKNGYGSFYTNLWDNISKINDDTIKKYIKTEEKDFEKY